MSLCLINVSMFQEFMLLAVMLAPLTQSLRAFYAYAYTAQIQRFK